MPEDEKKCAEHDLQQFCCSWCFLLFYSCCYGGCYGSHFDFCGFDDVIFFTMVKVITFLAVGISLKPIQALLLLLCCC